MVSFVACPLGTHMNAINNRAGTPPTIDFGALNYKQRGTSNNN